jgi:hypothetical protein
MFELKKYHGDRVMSLTYEDENESFSVGIISMGEYEFGAVKSEEFTVTSGVIRCWVEGDKGWITNKKGETFNVPSHKNFKLSVDKTSSYICYYD